MGRAEALEVRIADLHGELQDLLDEYVEVQERLRALEAVTDCDGEGAGERALADLPERLQRAAEAERFDRSASTTGRTGTAASQAEVAAAVKRIEELDHEATEEPDADDEETTTDGTPEHGESVGSESESGESGFDDIIVG